MSRITIKDIAKLLNVNPSTVSRALKDHPDISVETKRMVKKVAEELGYQPNFQAIHFRNRKSGLIGLIIPDISVFFLPSVIKAIEEVTHENGYNLIVFQSNDILDREIESTRICQGFGVDGLLASLSHQTRDVRHLKDIAEDGVPVVIFDRMLDNQAIPTVGIYDLEAATNAALHLLEKGYRRLGGIFGNPQLAITRQRYAGFVTALGKYQYRVEEELIVHANDQLEAREGMYRLLNLKNRPDAVFAMSDECLVGVMQAIYEMDVQVPGDMAIIAISDGDIPYYMNPKITHILHSGYEVGKNAATLLIDLMRQRSPLSSPIHIRVETELVDLGSV